MGGSYLVEPQHRTLANFLGQGIEVGFGGWPNIDYANRCKTLRPLHSQRQVPRPKSHNHHRCVCPVNNQAYNGKGQHDSRSGNVYRWLFSDFWPTFRVPVTVRTRRVRWKLQYSSRPDSLGVAVSSSLYNYRYINGKDHPGILTSSDWNLLSDLISSPGTT